MSFFAPIGIYALVILYICLSAIYFDVSKKVEYEHLTKPTFETEIDLFLVQWADSKNYALEAPRILCLPSSIEAYKKDPENWMFTDDFAEKRQQQDYFHVEKVLGIIPKGTRLKVVKIKKNSFGDVRGFFAHLEDNQFSKCLVDICSFLELWTLDGVPKMRTGYLKQATQYE